MLAASGNSSGLTRGTSPRSRGGWRVLEPAQDLGQLVLDRLVGADRAAEREPLLCVSTLVSRHVCTAPTDSAASSDWATYQASAQTSASTSRRRPARAGERDRSRASGSSRSGSRARSRRRRQPRAPRRRPATRPRSRRRRTSRSAPGASGDERCGSVEHDLFALHLGAGRLGSPVAGRRVRPSIRSRGPGRARRDVRRPELSAGDRFERLVTQPAFRTAVAGTRPSSATGASTRRTPRDEHRLEHASPAPPCCSSINRQANPPRRRFGHRSGSTLGSRAPRAPPRWSCGATAHPGRPRGAAAVRLRARGS